MTRYTRENVLRILHIQPQQLSSWERSHLIPVQDVYSFSDISRLRVLRQLSERRVSANSIRASIQAMQMAAGMSNPLLEATALASGRRLIFRHCGKVVDPLLNQFEMDFDAVDGPQLQLVNPSTKATRDAELQQMFLSAVALEENAANHKQAMLAYEHILSLHPNHAPSAINLGTLLYNQRLFAKAEECYRRATEMDPNYALAFFDLGNVLDELQRLPDAILAYRRAITLVPTYADAHYNLALAYERTGQSRRALQHWNRYIKLDPVGPWANHARTQQRKTLREESLAIVYRRSCPQLPVRQAL